MSMRLILLTLLLIGHSLAAGAAIYKWTTSDGTVIYSDHPQNNDKSSVELPEIQTFEARPVPPSSAPHSPPSEPDDKVSYQTLRLTQPANDETIRDNAGTVQVIVDMDPILQHSKGHRAILLLDNKAVGPPSKSLQFTLGNVDRGTHTLQVIIHDASGNTLISSEPITFHLRRQSQLLRKPR